MTDTQQALIVAGIAAAATLIAALIAAIATVTIAQRNRRRILYGEALKAALGWGELLYRVRRRTDETTPSLIERFHVHQENLIYYEGWIASESKYMARSYGRLVRAVKAKTMPLIQAAWNDELRNPPGNAIPDDVHPDFTEDSDAFMKDVRGFLSLFAFRKIAVAARNRRGKA